MKSIPVAAGSVLFIAMAGTALAEGKHPGESCLGIADPAVRLACYDAAFGQGGQAPARGDAQPGSGTTSVGAAAVVPPAPPPPAGAAEASVVQGVQDFGLSEAQRQARDGKDVDEKAPKSLEATVVKVASRPRGELVITLDNGQVWVQQEVDQRARVSAGDVVTIRKAALGSHLLVTAGGVATRVRRVE